VSTTAKDPGHILAGAKSVIIIPGYGMALAQAQGLVKRLGDLLEAGGADVKYAIHPVAGRMPGHMNVLLAEVDVPYDKLYEIDDVNPMFESCDAAIVIGANDVLNPAANTAVDTPIYGMPILDVEKAKAILFCNYDTQPGYAGVPNPLYEDPRAILLLGDAKESLDGLIRACRAAATNRRNRDTSTWSTLSRSRYPSPERASTSLGSRAARPGSNARRRCITQVWMTVAACRGGSSPHNAETSASRDTGRPSDNASTANTIRCCTGPSRTTSAPRHARTSPNRSTRNSVPVTPNHRPRFFTWGSWLASLRSHRRW